MLVHHAAAEAPGPCHRALADTATVATGQPVDQISCQTGEQTLFHIHAHLAIFVNGKARQVSAAIGTPLIAPQPVTFPTGL